MTDIGSTNRIVSGRIVSGMSAPAIPPQSWGQKFDAFFQSVFDGLMSCLCRASRGYLCPPDMPSLMYPDEPPLPGTRPPDSRHTRIKECCDEKLPGK